jgi:hypothetical protein
VAQAVDGQQRVLHRILGLVGIEDAAARDAAQQRQRGAQQRVVGARVAGLRRRHPGFPDSVGLRRRHAAPPRSRRRRT